MANFPCLIAGIILLIIGGFLLFTDTGTAIFAPGTDSEDIVGVGFYLNFISYTLFLSGIALIVRCFLKEK